MRHKEYNQRKKRSIFHCTSCGRESVLSIDKGPGPHVCGPFCSGRLVIVPTREEQRRERAKQELEELRNPSKRL